MRCPFCKLNDDKVIDSRESTDAFVIRRRRECLKCGRRFTTRERIDETPLRVIKRDGGREDFDRRKILSGMISACQKRPVSIQSLEEITQRIEDKLLDSPEREVQARFIGNLAMKELRKLDKVAYVRFASVYKNFESPEDFAEIAEEMAGAAAKDAGRAAAKDPPKTGAKDDAKDETKSAPKDARSPRPRPKKPAAPTAEPEGPSS
jgi:transcriptional repressor NrdR